jgi:hypothetical protein
MLLEIIILSSFHALELNIISSAYALEINMLSSFQRQIGRLVDSSWLVFISLCASMLLLIRLVLQQLYLAFL